MYVCRQDYLKLGFRGTRRLSVRIIWTNLDWIASHIAVRIYIMSHCQLLIFTSRRNYSNIAYCISNMAIFLVGVQYF